MVVRNANARISHSKVSFGRLGTSAVSANGTASEPLTSIGHPPTDNRDGNRGGERPPERQDDIGNQAQQGEHDPEDLAFHKSILSSSSASEPARITNSPPCNQSCSFPLDNRPVWPASELHVSPHQDLV